MRATNHRMTVLAQDGDRVRREIDGLKRQIEGTVVSELRCSMLPFSVIVIVSRCLSQSNILQKEIAQENEF